MKLADILNANIQKNGSPTEPVPDVNALRRCLAKVLDEAIERARVTGAAETYAFLSPRHADHDLINRITMAVKSRDSSNNFENAVIELERVCGLPVMIGLTASQKVLFLFGRHNPRVNKTDMAVGTPMTELKGEPVPEKRKQTKVKRALPPPEEVIDVLYTQSSRN